MTTPHSSGRWQECAQCHARLAELDPRVACPECGGLLQVRFDLAPGSGTALRRAFAERATTIGAPRETSGVWRYAELVSPASPSEIVAFPEGNTPHVHSAAVAEWAGCERLTMKHEGMNPTGSFKDRGMTVGVTQAMRLGARAVGCASTGNTSASLAAYAARAGLPAVVLVPAGRIAIGKLTQTLSYGARTLAVRGDFDDCLRLVRESAEKLGLYLLNSVNPWRVEGQKSIVLELLHQLDWDPPDWIALPAGNLGNLGAFGKALEEALAVGLIDRLPRLLAVQAAGAAPFQQSFREGFATRHTLKPETIATAIRIGDPASHDRGVHAIRLTSGAVVAVDDALIMESQAVIGAAGIGCEPASAASVAGVRTAVGDGLIDPGARVACILTGHVLKDPGALLSYHMESVPAPARRNAPVEIDATIDAVARELDLMQSPSRSRVGLTSTE